MKIIRYSWDEFPEVWIHAQERPVKHHPDYSAAKSGDSDAAFRLVEEFASADVCGQLKNLFPCPTLVSAHAIERNGLNAIPEALAEYLAACLGWPVDHGVIQTNIVGHTGANGFTRLARQARFGGPILPGTYYFLVDDFVGQGGTLANLRSFILRDGGHVLGATCLTGKHYSARLSPAEGILNQLREKHGHELERWWLAQFGFGYECLTHSEANYLLKTPNADRIRDQITSAVQN